MDSKVIDYLQENKDKFPLEILKKKLIENGHDKEGIDEAISYIKRHENSPKQEEIPLFPNPDKYKDEKEIEKGEKKNDFVKNPLEHEKEEVKEKTSGKAITSFVLGIISFFIGWVPIIGWLLILLSLIFGFLSLKEMKDSTHLKGKTLAIVGIVLAFLSLIGIIMIMILFHSILSSLDMVTNITTSFS